jgi:hypothetical protein
MPAVRRRIRTMGSAVVLTEKMDALADALRAAGVEPARVARILGSAAEATMHALMLDAVLDEQSAEATATRVAAGGELELAVAADETHVRLAA